VRILLGAASLLVGLGLGVAGGFWQAVVVPVPGINVPLVVGVLVVLAALVLFIRSATWMLNARWGGWLVFAGWLLGTASVGFETAGGDVALGTGVRPVAYVALAAILGSAAASLPLPLKKTTPTG
jgi:hypothetical protein